MFKMFQTLNKPAVTNEIAGIRVSEWPTYNNYTKWCKLMHIAISGQGPLNHIIVAPPPPTDLKNP